MALVYIRDKYGNFVPVPSIKGDPGYTPVRGKDYWTELDQEEIKSHACSYVDNKIESYVDSKIIGADVVPVSEDRTLDLADAGKFMRVDAAAFITVPADTFPAGTEIEVFRNTSDVVVLEAGDGVSFVIPGNSGVYSQTISGQYTSVVLKHIGDNVWSVRGDLAAGYTRWSKYACEITLEEVYTTTETDWELVSGGGVEDGDSITGYPEYTYVSIEGRRFAVTGYERTITAPDTGTVYRVSNNGLTVEKDIFFTDEVYGTCEENYRKTLTNTLGYDKSYKIGDHLGYVRVADDERLADVENKSYYGSYAGYTILEDSDGNYYAYKKEVST